MTKYSFRGKRVLVLGAGKSGLSAQKFLTDRGAEVTMYEDYPVTPDGVPPLPRKGNNIEKNIIQKNSPSSEGVPPQGGGVVEIIFQIPLPRPASPSTPSPAKGNLPDARITAMPALPCPLDNANIASFILNIITKILLNIYILALKIYE